MSILSISSLSMQATLVNGLQTEQQKLTTLTQQLSSKKKHSDLTDYSASDARNLINLQSTAQQKQTYINIINSVSNNLSVYDTTLTDLESIASQAQSLANDNPNYSTDVASNVAIQAENYLRSVTVDLNQQVNGRYLYSGSRYNTAPAQDLSALSTSTLTSTITNTAADELPSYDTGYSASSISLSTSGQNVTVSGAATGSQSASVIVNGTTYTYAVQASDTPTTIAANLASLITAGGVATTSSGATLTVGVAGTITDSYSSVTNTSAYTTDTATVDDGYNLNYGITSNDPAIQKLVAGLRYLQAAGKSTTSAAYKTNMDQATSLLNSALTSIQSLHTTVANNTNIMKTEKTTQTSAITNLTTQVNNIQEVDVTQVSAEITSMETILQASYSATGSLLKLSIVSYL